MQERGKTKEILILRRTHEERCLGQSGCGVGDAEGTRSAPAGDRPRTELKGDGKNRRHLPRLGAALGRKRLWSSLFLDGADVVITEFTHAFHAEDPGHLNAAAVSQLTKRLRRQGATILATHLAAEPEPIDGLIICCDGETYLVLRR